jgi:hypothetical protein
MHVDDGPARREPVTLLLRRAIGARLCYQSEGEVTVEQGCVGDVVWQVRTRSLKRSEFANLLIAHSAPSRRDSSMNR